RDVHQPLEGGLIVATEVVEKRGERDEEEQDNGAAKDEVEGGVLLFLGLAHETGFQIGLRVWIGDWLEPGRNRLHRWIAGGKDRVVVPIASHIRVSQSRPSPSGLWTCDVSRPPSPQRLPRRAGPWQSYRHRALHLHHKRQRPVPARQSAGRYRIRWLPIARPRTQTRRLPAWARLDSAPIP